MWLWSHYFQSLAARCSLKLRIGCDRPLGLTRSSPPRCPRLTRSRFSPPRHKNSSHPVSRARECNATFARVSLWCWIEDGSEGWPTLFSSEGLWQRHSDADVRANIYSASSKHADSSFWNVVKWDNASLECCLFNEATHNLLWCIRFRKVSQIKATFFFLMVLMQSWGTTVRFDTWPINESMLYKQVLLGCNNVPYQKKTAVLICLFRSCIFTKWITQCVPLVSCNPRCCCWPS